VYFGAIDFNQHRLYKKQNTTMSVRRCCQTLVTTVPKGVIWRRSALILIRPLNYRCVTLSGLVEILINIITRSLDLNTTKGIGLAAIPALLCLSDSAAIAQISLGERSMSQVNVLFVNPTIGNDKISNGSRRSPFKTITQALWIAKPNNVIVLSSGTYSTDSGERFPLMLKPGVTIQGDPYTRGRNILIQGGGAFLSPTFARQDVTILGANQAGVTGVTVTNPNPRGYGLWIESSSPVVVDNTFIGNNHDGISITGNSAPTIRRNYFYQNGANGMTIYGTSRPEVRENVFEKTGFGINIAQYAAPLLVGNRIIQNRSGVVAQANSRPILRGNVIEGNREDGVVAIATSQPDLGTTTEPGGNVFGQNGRYDINSSASVQIIHALGNQLALRRISGRVDFLGLLSAARSLTTPAQRTKPIELPALPPKPAPMEPVDIPVAPPESTAQEPPVQTARSQKMLPLLQSGTIVESKVIAVPSPNIPIGNRRKPPKVAVFKNSRTTSLGLRYRVVVEARSQRQQARVRSLVPGAFRTVSKGRVSMQAGAFSDRVKANEVLQILKSKGLKAVIEHLN